MPSPRSRELTDEAEKGLAELLRRADASKDAVLGEAYDGRNVRDVLAHLHAWHVVFDGWVAQERAGSEPAYPAEGYTWDDLKSLNDALYLAHRERPYEAVRSMLVASHRMMLEVLDSFTEEELTHPDTFGWLGRQTLGDVAHECLGGHYEWALRTLDAAGIA